MKYVDVLLPFHRYDNFLLQSIESVLDSSQVFVNLILIDDRSDKSQNLKFLEKRNIKLVQNFLPHGYGNALISGSRYLNNNYVSLMNSDDYISKNKFFRQIELVSEDGICFTGMERVNSNGSKSKSMVRDFRGKKYDPIFLTMGSYGANASWLLPTNVWLNFELDNSSCLDWRLAMRYFPNLEIHYLSETLYFYRRHKFQENYQEMNATDLENLFLSWNRFVSTFNLPSADFEIFGFLAAPWLKSKISDFNSVSTWVNSLKIFVSQLDSDLNLTFHDILRRRYSFALNPQVSKMTQMPKILSGSKLDILKLILDTRYL